MRETEEIPDSWPGMALHAPSSALAHGQRGTGHLDRVKGKVLPGLN
jgi:hypothetical protein